MAFAVTLFVVPFVVLSVIYPAIPPRVPVLTIGHPFLEAAKSPFIVFRVPFMNALHGAMALIMLSHSRDFVETTRQRAYRRAFACLFFVIGLKAALEALAVAAAASPSLASFGQSIAVTTLISVVGGIAIAFWYSRGVPLPWPELHLGTLHKTALCGLFALYLAIITASFSISHRWTAS